MPHSSDQALLIFIKNPRKGKVKTRLAASVGEDEALSIYKKLLNYTHQIALNIPADKMLWYSQSVKKGDNWDDTEFIKKEQRGESLGQRMKYAFEQAFEQGYTKAVVIGSDCGQLETKHIAQAYQALNYHDVVVGPSEDGGYYLLGMSRFLPVLFEGKSWSTEHVLEQTLEECRKHDWYYHILEELNDVDTEKDWQQVKDKF